MEVTDCCVNSLVINKKELLQMQCSSCLQHDSTKQCMSAGIPTLLRMVSACALLRAACIAARASISLAVPASALQAQADAPRHDSSAHRVDELLQGVIEAVVASLVGAVALALLVILAGVPAGLVVVAVVVVAALLLALVLAVLRGQTISDMLLPHHTWSCTDVLWQTSPQFCTSSSICEADPEFIQSHGNHEVYMSKHV